MAKRRRISRSGPSLDSNHAARCGCEPCKTVREILRRKRMLDDRLFQQVETYRRSP